MVVKILWDFETLTGQIWESHYEEKPMTDTVWRATNQKLYILYMLDTTKSWQNKQRAAQHSTEQHRTEWTEQNRTEQNTLEQNSQANI